MPPSPVRVATPPKREGARAPTGCQLGDLFHVLGESYVLDILYVFLIDPKPRRFGAVQTELKMSANTLTERLKELVRVGLLSRQAFNEIPPRVEYQATAKARELQPIFLILAEWAQKNSLRPIVATV